MPEGPHGHTLLFNVSIRARPRGRAMLRTINYAERQTLVSIRARPRGRAMPPVAPAAAGRRRCFNPRPA